MPAHRPTERPARKDPAYQPAFVVVLSPQMTRSINRELRQIDREFRARVKAIRTGEPQARKTSTTTAA
jgi:hypothetical protein